jgi:hypothetical protein
MIMRTSSRSVYGIAATFCIAMSLAGLSQQVEAANGWKGPVAVSSVISNPAGGALLLLELNDASCGSSGNQFNIAVGSNGMTADGAKASMALALTALTLGKPISIVVDDTLPGCPIQEVRIDQ